MKTQGSSINKLGSKAHSVTNCLWYYLRYYSIVPQIVPPIVPKPPQKT